MQSKNTAEDDERLPLVIAAIFVTIYSRTHRFRIPRANAFSVLVEYPDEVCRR